MLHPLLIQEVLTTIGVGDGQTSAHVLEKLTDVRLDVQNLLTL